MGFFDKLKSAASAVTGGSAKVTAQVEGAPARGENATVTIRATASADCKVDNVYLLVRCREEADVRDTDFDGGKVERETVRGRKTAWKTKLQVAGACQLSDGQSETWTASVSIPSDGLPTVRGQMVRVVWECQAGLDMFGNDPDSGWIKFTVR